MRAVVRIVPPLAFLVLVAHAACSNSDGPGTSTDDAGSGVDSGDTPGTDASVKESGVDSAVDGGGAIDSGNDAGESYVQCRKRSDCHPTPNAAISCTPTPGGYCDVCVPGDPSTAICPSGTVCSNGTCFRPCVTSTECGNPALECRTAGGGDLYCVAKTCGTCPAPYVCSGGFCERPACPDGGGCTMGFSCVEGFCVEP